MDTLAQNGMPATPNILTESSSMEDLPLEDIVSVFPGAAPWVIGVTISFWLVNQYFAVVKAKPDARSLRVLRQAKEAADLAKIGTPEHQLLARLHRAAGIEYAVRSHVPSPRWSWGIVGVGTLAGVAQSINSPDQGIIFAWLINAALPVGTLIATQLEVRRERALFREYCRQNTVAGDVEKLVLAIKEKARSTTPKWALRPLDKWRSRPTMWLHELGVGIPPVDPTAVSVAEARSPENKESMLQGRSRSASLKGGTRR